MNKTLPLPANKVATCPPHHLRYRGNGLWWCIKPGCTYTETNHNVDPEDRRGRFKAKMSKGGKKGRAALTAKARAGK